MNSDLPNIRNFRLAGSILGIPLLSDGDERSKWGDYNYYRLSNPGYSDFPRSSVPIGIPEYGYFPQGQIGVEGYSEVVLDNKPYITAILFFNRKIYFVVKRSTFPFHDNCFTKNCKRVFIS